MSVADGARELTPAAIARLLGRPDPTPEQAEVIAAPLEPGVVVAGAGSGKSETMAGRVVWLVANGHVRPENVLGLTFTRKAVSELAERVRDRLDQLRATEQVPAELLDGEPTVSTYNSYAARLVRDHALREAVEPSTRLISEGQSWQLAARIVGGYDGPMDAVTVGPTAVTARMLDLAGELGDHLRTPDDVRAIGRWIDERAAALPKKPTAPAKAMIQTQRKREQLLPLVERYIAAKSAREVMDYSDQVALAARIAIRHPEVGLTERGRFQVVLLDEYQDTSFGQLALLRALFAGGHPVTAVGDPCQSIYGWRGASAGNLTSFPTDFPAVPGRPASVRRLATSFRNGERVLQVAKRVSERLREEADYVPVLYPGPARVGRGTVACGLFGTETEEADWIARTVDAALTEPAGLAPDGAAWPAGEDPGRPVTPGDVAILCRKRSQFTVLREALERRDIPVEVVGLGGLLTVPEVRDVVAVLRVLHDPAMGNELARILTGPRWRIGPRDLVALGERAAELAKETRRDLRGAPAAADPGADGPELLQQTVIDLTAESGSLVDALDDLGDPERYSETGHERLARLAAELRALRRVTPQPLPELIGEIERALSLDIETAARPGGDPMAARADLDAFSDAAVRFVGNSDDPSLGSFLGFLRSAEDAEKGLEPGERVGARDTVKLMTVHAAKGLQWPLVVVPGLSGGKTSPLFPTRARDAGGWAAKEQKLPYPLRGDSAGLPRIEDLDKAALDRFKEAEKERHVLEERRLAYVAVTRASFALLCTGHWWGRGAAGHRGPSVFLEEVREACENGAGRVAQWAEPPAEGAVNPQLAEADPVPWPQRSDEYEGDAAQRHARVVAGARLVEEARAGGGARWLQALDRSTVRPSLQRRLDGWGRDTELLLAADSPDRADTDGGPIAVELPAHLSVSSLVSLARDPDALARQIRRPMPRPPAPHTRRGTAFHTWLERRFGQESLLDPDELPGAADDTAGGDDDFDELRARFEASEWADRVPLAVEVAFETIIGDRLVRGRMDAVFRGADPESGRERYDVVDWKTGHPPGTPRERRAVAVQLAAYRIAWAHLAGVPLAEVGAAFHYVRADLTVRPVDLPDAEGLEALITGVPEES
ncbi:DNA helicase-2/ATP-dependent DNA helicase PcrA [Murinocardiopsis flavida]|uniref:DNA 3'-5' helicase n=1 Tax=Murinocardiopsis flavida TaxID=645275 RepID=A0A2P8DJH5_9ACTN|nr:ATP-dependent DNA helicase [Murinocardiopsis flavida]PSK97376.1 DNA helicase-2/ATP-dependent DNA helicase PcrA [Murinocardiopsis flavida]